MNHNLLMLRRRLSLPSVFGVPLRWCWSRGLPPATTLLVWALVAYAAVMWGLRWSAIGRAPSRAVVANQPLSELDVTAAARSLGATPEQAVTEPSLASRFELQGVLTRPAPHGAALMSVDGKPAKPYRVGAVVVDGLVLQSVKGRRAILGTKQEGPQTLVLELPAKK